MPVVLILEPTNQRNLMRRITSRKVYFGGFHLLMYAFHNDCWPDFGMSRSK